VSAPHSKRPRTGVSTASCSADLFPPECTNNEDHVLKYLKDHGVTNVAITKGLDRVRLVSGTAMGTVQIPHVPVVDTMGAGDIPHDAFCYYVSNGIAKYVTVIPN